MILSESPTSRFNQSDFSIRIYDNGGYDDDDDDDDKESGKRRGGLFTRFFSNLFMGPHRFDLNFLEAAASSIRDSSKAGDNKQLQQRLQSKYPFETSTNVSEESTCSISSSSSDDDDDDESSVFMEVSSSKTNTGTIAGHDPEDNNYIYAFRSGTDIIVHFLLELSMLKTHSKFIMFAIFFQFVHNFFTNIAYYYQTKLSAAQRVPLTDAGFSLLPKLTGDWWMVSEYIFTVILAFPGFLTFSILFIRWKLPHGKPLYAVSILRRICMTLVCCQCLRIISFLVTTLPGASRQCLYNVPDNLTSQEMVNKAADPGGNPRTWAPPMTLYEIIFRLDATTGCGDLMFSSHTIFSMTFVCLTFKYFNWPYLTRSIAMLQLIILPFIIAARKHYSVDVFTALYVTPLVFEMLDRRFPDYESSTDLRKMYKIDFNLYRENDGTVVSTVEVFKKISLFNIQDVPIDLIQSFVSSTKKSLDEEHGSYSQSHWQDTKYYHDNTTKHESLPFDNQHGLSKRTSNQSQNDNTIS